MTTYLQNAVVTFAFQLFRAVATRQQYLFSVAFGAGLGADFEQVVTDIQVEIPDADAGHLDHDQGMVRFFEDVHNRLMDLVYAGLPRLGVRADVAEGLRLRMCVLTEPYLDRKAEDPLQTPAGLTGPSNLTALPPGLLQPLQDVGEAFHKAAAPVSVRLSSPRVFMSRSFVGDHPSDHAQGAWEIPIRFSDSL